MLSGEGGERKTLDDHWRWAFDLRARLKDESTSGVEVQFTTQSAEVSI